MLNKIELKMSQITSGTRRSTHKHGVEVPVSFKYAAEIGSRRKITFWRDSTIKETKIMCATFDVLETGQACTAGNKKASSHLAYGSLMGTRTYHLKLLRMLCESAIKSFDCLVLSDSGSWACDIQIACLKVLTTKKDCFL